MRNEINKNSIIRYLSEYGCIPVNLLYALVATDKHTKLSQQISEMEKYGIVQMIDNNRYVRLNVTFEKNQKVIDALWVMSKYADHINDRDHCACDYPSQVFFLRQGLTEKEEKTQRTNAEKNNKEFVLPRPESYEIAVFGKDEEDYLRLLNVDKYLKYIIVIPDMDNSERYTSVIKSTALTPDQYVFATVNQKEVGENPEIRFYKPQ